jgi:hypothetical protein
MFEVDSRRGGKRLLNILYKLTKYTLPRCTPAMHNVREVCGIFDGVPLSPVPLV